MKLGCIADDFTGATDLANNLVRAGMRVVQAMGVPMQPLDSDADAVVVALKTRTLPANEAIEESLAALRWLQAQGAQQIYFKYCSTFDSTAQGNIGPVTEALMDALADETGSDFTIATPAFPDNQRTVFKGHLFVGDVLLNESGMQNHPLTPMTDANLVRFLQTQCRRSVGLIDYKVVAQGETAIRERIAELRAQGVGVAVVDAISNDDLLRLGPALKGMPLVTAGSGVAIGLPANFGIAPSNTASALPAAIGLQAVVSGSCSLATNRQVMAFIKSGQPAFSVDALQVAAGVDVTRQALAWAAPLLVHGPVLIYSTAQANTVKMVQGRLGVEQAGAMLERTLAAIAHGLVALGVRQLVLAGGETAGACVQALNITQMKIGLQIDPGVPWCHAQTEAAIPDGLHLTLKSGNFGTDDFFTKAFTRLA
ncbi:MAG: four-carbon acid sugar kinase family protein [Gammaproteobacteria bacterium]|uniref:3-oxo-tetronate kinase n=1 Tax=Rhodoferax sp. TaxID=50421 RepID=UPI00180F98B4|nr:3-oxo-tetronate kinase [Rhodoferax sp.]MBU3900142.1 four-carbon acid sugar kinase family protein [Gammaproteobacteria bacterium]MBA3058724.1 four-carbon acid sugar kinase family protein [Rhodoferax sp.]MBU3996678.1 four-carbon acid sugar kinase family protein [Gammaproteobacteria bacterium]MBU4018326.1 four-carbon acid sugar kinase family protein [Gammaproteobacteria bacterium]MBU4082180.1 four-carbon acid sugar kinase family protein [Gammaproteobacteria bacterium]